MAAPYHFQYDLTLDDYEAYAVYALKKAHRKSRNYRYLYGVLLLLLATWELYTRNFTISPIYVLAILFALWLILLPLQVKYSAKAQVRAIMKTARLGTILGYRDITLSESDIKISTSLSDEICKWGIVQKIETSPTQVLIFLSDLQAHIIPFKEIGNESAVNELVAFCQVQLERSYNKEEIGVHLID